MYIRVRALTLLQPSTINTKIIHGSKYIIREPYSAHNVLRNLLIKFVDIVHTIKWMHLESSPYV